MKQKQRKQSRRQRRRRTQRGGGWGYTGPAFTPMSPMAPEASRTTYNDACDPPARPAPDVSRFATQFGGGCSTCSAPTVLMNQSGGGSGTGGYAVNVGSNDIGKMYSSLVPGPCPPAPQGPREFMQQGGGSPLDPQLYGIESTTAGYGYGPASVKEIGGGTAHYLDQISYGVERQLRGGARRKSRKGRKSRKVRR